MRRLVLADNQPTASGIDNPFKAVGNCAPRQFFDPHAVIGGSPHPWCGDLSLFELRFQIVTRSGSKERRADGALRCLALNSLRTHSNTPRAPISWIHSAPPNGQRRPPCAAQGRQEIPRPITIASKVYGKNPSSGVVAQKIATVGTLRATATCMGALSFDTNTVQRLIAAASSRKLT